MLSLCQVIHNHLYIVYKQNCFVSNKLYPEQNGTKGIQDKEQTRRASRLSHSETRQKMRDKSIGHNERHNLLSLTSLLENTFN